MDVRVNISLNGVPARSPRSENWGAPHASGGPYLRVARVPSDEPQTFQKKTKKSPYPCLVPAHERLWCAQSSRAHASPQYL